MGLLSLDTLLTAPNYRPSLLATLFALPTFTVEAFFGPDSRVPKTLVVAAVDNFRDGGNCILDIDAMTVDTQTVFLSALRSDESFGVQSVNGDWQPGQSGDGFSAEQIESLQTQLAS